MIAHGKELGVGAVAPREGKVASTALPSSAGPGLGQEPGFPAGLCSRAAV